MYWLVYFEILMPIHLCIVRQTRHLFVYFERNTRIDLCILIQICTFIYLLWDKDEFLFANFVYLFANYLCILRKTCVYICVFSDQTRESICVFSEHGGWSMWSSWTECSVTCGEGEQLRSRTCTAPAPAHGGHDCIGDSIGKRACQLHKCGGKWMFAEKG